MYEGCWVGLQRFCALMKGLYTTEHGPPSKLCVREAILGSDSISYTLVSQVDMFGKLQSRSTHSEDCCGEICIETRRILLHGLDPQFAGRYEYIERKLAAHDRGKVWIPMQMLSTFKQFEAHLEYYTPVIVSSSSHAPHIPKCCF